MDHKKRGICLIYRFLYLLSKYTRIFLYILQTFLSKCNPSVTINIITMSNCWKVSIYSHNNAVLIRYYNITFNGVSTVRDGFLGQWLAWEEFLHNIGEDLDEVVDRLHRKKILVNQDTSTNVYTSVHNLYTLCCIPVFTVEPVWLNSGQVR